MLIDEKKLQFYVKKNLNVLFEGERGVGKTSIIYKTFNTSGLRLKYFSAPTMDPWTDLVGVPTTVTRTDGKEVLRMVPPEDFADDKYDAIFIDELNRAPPKVLDALMELIQFKTINGKPYNIKMIWAAINPHSEDNNDYHVEPLDKALKDRFQIQIKIPYKVDEKFFYKEHGEVGSIFCDWWNNQPKDVQKEISPRRLFESIDFYMSGGDLEDIIKYGNIEKLKTDVKNASLLKLMNDEFNAKKIEKSAHFLKGNYSAQIEKFLLRNQETFNFFMPFMNQEWISQKFYQTQNNTISKYILENAKNTESVNHQKSKEIVTSILESATKAFIKNNLQEYKEFLSDERKKEFEQIPNIVSYKMPTEKMDKNSIYIPPLHSSPNKEEVDELIEKAKEQIVYKIAFNLALTRQLCKMETDGAKKLFDSTLNKKNPKNIFLKNFSELIPRIQKAYEDLLNFTPEELSFELEKLSKKPRVNSKPKF